MGIYIYSSFELLVFEIQKHFTFRQSKGDRFILSENRQKKRNVDTYEEHFVGVHFI